MWIYTNTVNIYTGDVIRRLVNMDAFSLVEPYDPTQDKNENEHKKDEFKLKGLDQIKSVAHSINGEFTAYFEENVAEIRARMDKQLIYERQRRE